MQSFQSLSLSMHFIIKGCALLLGLRVKYSDSSLLSYGSS